MNFRSDDPKGAAAWMPARRGHLTGAVRAVAALTAASGPVVAIGMYETRPRS